jgi:demethylmenaquinone methyltransferase/2-methoxy-6-polyprenyl-1,4-benzoquinol methylase
MMETGRPKVTKAGYQDRIAYVQGDAEQMSFDAGRFDAAMVGFGIRNLTHLEEGFEEMYRILKPGGKLMCLEFSRPTSTPFRWLYDFYSFHVMPLLGQIIGGSRQAYTYLPESIRLFPLPDGLSRILKDIGFSQVTYRRLTNGIAVLHLAIKG